MITQDRYNFDNDVRREHNVVLLSGSDEVGRGAMAGPLVVASVVLPPDYVNPEIDDSKNISKVKREQLFNEIIEVALDYAIKIYDHNFVDKYNPKRTSQIGMEESLLELKVKPDLCLLDAEKINIAYKTLSIIKGDSKSQ